MRLVVFIGFTLVVLAAIVVILRVVVRRDYQRKGRLTALSSLSEWALGLIWASFGYYYMPADWPNIHVGPALQITGWIFIVIASLIIILSLAWLGFHMTHGLRAEVLVQEGPYRLSRNPQAVGFCLGISGYVFLWPSWYMVMSLFLLAVLIHLMVRTEEEHLLDRHGETYRLYCEQVPRFTGIPQRIG